MVETWLWLLAQYVAPKLPKVKVAHTSHVKAVAHGETVAQQLPEKNAKTRQNKQLQHTPLPTPCQMNYNTRLRSRQMDRDQAHVLHKLDYPEDFARAKNGAGTEGLIQDRD